MPKPLVFFVVGTRPEAIKVAPVIREFRAYAELVESRVISTGQHKEILLAALATFDVVPDEDLAIMRHGQTLAGVTARAVEGIDQLIESQSPSLIMGQGDTTTTFAAALTAFYRQIPFGHIEAGLRTDTINNPFPEEFNRRAAGLVAALHFSPTNWASSNLLREGKDPSTVFITGNTSIDAVLYTAERQGEKWFSEHPGRVLTMTTHRRENWGEPQQRIAEAALEIVNRFEDLLLVVAMHPNPSVRATLTPILGNHPRIQLIEPPEYARFVGLMKRSTLILSDSGGVQEEAPAFGVPVLVMRDTTERPEGIEAGTNKLVGTDRDAIVQEATKLLSDPLAYRAMSQASSPYGDGHASARIRFATLRYLGIESPFVEMWR